MPSFSLPPKLYPCFAVALCLSSFLLGGCNTLEGKVAAGAWGATAALAQAPAHEVEQIHYIGVFDPHEQVPPSVYRVRVRGQASFMSRTNFASGWVHASLVDSLGTNMSFNNETGSWNVSKVEERETTKLKTGRRQMLFGPLGFREQPADHRLCIVMGANPDEWFRAMDEALGVVADAVSERRVGELKSDVFDQITTAKQEQKALESLETSITVAKKDESTGDTEAGDAAEEADDAADDAGDAAADAGEAAADAGDAAEEAGDAAEEADDAASNADEASDTAGEAAETATDSAEEAQDAADEAKKAEEASKAILEEMKALQKK